VEQSSGVGVLDKGVRVLGALSAGPAALADLVERTRLPRATAHHLAGAREVHGLVARDREGRYVLGPRLAELAAAAGDPAVDAAVAAAGPVLVRLRDATGESAQLYLRRDGARICVAAAERRSGLRDTVPVGSVLSMTAGSAAQVLLAWEPRASGHLAVAAFSPRVLADVRRRGWASSVAEREAGVASVSAPVREAGGRVVAAISVSGPLERLGRSPGARLAGPVTAAAAELGAALGR
jgi:DNA-binding IclR family transcriptional regulator